ncbi:TPA: ead/Ea22-like family protein [Serratia marcescens]|nr:ead/Ea22-like family protein [Serratia marcescens]
MDKFSELKRLAEKCPVQRFEPFIGRAGGRGTQAIFNADTKGEVITWSGFDSSDVTSRTGREAIARFVAAVDPETVLALLAGLEAKDKRIDELESKLATPVRLLGEMLPHEWERAERQAAFEHRKIAWDARLAEDKKAILSAGFTVEGDE